MLAAKIAMDYRSGNFTSSEADIAVDIFRMLLKDLEKRVRISLAEQLAHCQNAPRDIILKLANDETDVAVHVLEYSHVLTENDLVAIVNSTREMLKLRAIARRDTLSEGVSASLMATHLEPVVKDLLKNQGAALNEDDLEHEWNFIFKTPELLEALVHRGGLPIAIVEKMLFAVSEELKLQLIQRYKLKIPTVQKAVSDVREWEMLGVLPAHDATSRHDDEQVEDLVDGLHMNHRLTHSLLMRAVCMGNLSVFEAGIAKLAGVPRVNARILLMDSGDLGFDAIYKAASMPEGFREAVRTLLRLSLEETEFGKVRRADFRKRIIERIYVERHHINVENMEYLLSIIGGKIAATANVH